MCLPRVIRCVLLGLLLAAVPATPAAGQSQDAWVASGPDGEPRIRLWFFWSQHCPHCREAGPYVRELAARTPWLELRDLELSGHPENAQRYMELAGALGSEARYVPAFLFCERMLVGWDSAEGMGTHLAEGLKACRESLAASAPDAAGDRADFGLALPLLGELDSGKLSLPVITLVLAGLDAFNPCAFFVLLFLLSLLVHLRDRRRMLMIGGLYVAVSGVMYFAFMAAWLNAFLIVGNMPWVTIAAGVLAIGLGAINIKDFVAFKRGVSLSITESRRADIFRRGRRILAAGSLPAMVGATLLLAVAANLYELLCTAGFPMVYTRVLTLQAFGPGEHYLWLAMYNIVYVLPLLLIVVVFVRSMGGRQLSERQGRLLKLLSGLMMLGLGGVLLAAPGLFNNLAVALGLLAAALGVTWIAARLTRG